jgi:hypothetical protein
MTFFFGANFLDDFKKTSIIYLAMVTVGYPGAIMNNEQAKTVYTTLACFTSFHVMVSG